MNAPEEKVRFHPLPCSDREAWAFLNDQQSKTQIRRVMNPQPVMERGIWRWKPKGRDINVAHINASMSPFGSVGDRLWVQEMWGTVPMRRKGELAQPTDEIVYRASDDLLLPDHQYVGHWRPSTTMPRWASRITREVVAVRREQVQGISEADAESEGAPEWASTDLFGKGNRIRPGGPNKHRKCFEYSWDPDNAKRGPAFCFDANPWVWVGEVRRVEKEDYIND